MGSALPLAFARQALGALFTVLSTVLYSWAPVPLLPAWVVCPTRRRRDSRRADAALEALDDDDPFTDPATHRGV